jgi:hypothetical protein
MGYSATTEAFKTMDLIGDLLDQHQPHRVGSNEFWTEGGRIAFWEVGREQVDGSMTGSIHVDPTGNGTYVKVGGFKIHANGNLIRFPQLPKHIRDAVRNSEDRRNARFELQRQRAADLCQAGGRYRRGMGSGSGIHWRMAAVDRDCIRGIATVRRTSHVCVRQGAFTLGLTRETRDRVVAE